MSAITQAPADVIVTPAAPVATPVGPAVGPLLRLWRLFKGIIVLLIVVFHLFVLAVRNPLDLWYKQVRAWMEKHPQVVNPDSGEPEPVKETYWVRHKEKFTRADDFTWRYTNLVGLEQRWSMFGPPLSRSADFLAVRLVFTDGSQEMLLSANEPNPTAYFRFGGWQVRKLEDYMAYPPDDLASDGERTLWEAYARHKYRQWQQARPGDPRQLARIVFVKRRIYFPEPGQTYADVDPPGEFDIVSFDASGKLLP